MNDPATTVTVLTPPGRGAVASVSIRGSQAVALVEQCFSAASGMRLSELPQRRIAFGRWQAAAGPGEELIVCRFDDQRVEIHCHGGMAAVEAIVSSLVAAGATRRSPEDSIAREEPDRIAVEARLALAEAKTERTALILLDQYHGALRREVEEILDAWNRGEQLAGLLKLSLLSQRSKAGQHLTSPWRVAIVGPPNVGKSSLMNALVGYSRSIVFDQPGTTRDPVRAETAFDGWPIELVDTAGLRQTEDSIESAGVERAQQAMAAADLRLVVSDSAAHACSNSPDNDSTGSRPEISIYNKIDLRTDRDPFFWPGVKVSAKTGEGLPDLVSSILQALLGIAPSAGDAVPFTLRQIALIAEARRAAEKNDFQVASSLLARLLA
jgi:tRNA modification GTPase